VAFGVDRDAVTERDERDKMMAVAERLRALWDQTVELAPP
jgi:hypothetical protein